jgi:resuscitation-promoting factor RpfB
MDAIYYLCGTLMSFTTVGLIIAGIYYLLKPHHLQKIRFINKPVSRVAIFAIVVVSIIGTTLGYGSVMAATEPSSVKEARIAREAADTQAKKAAEEERLRQEETSKPRIEKEVKTEVVAFESVEQEDSTLAKGQTKVSNEGVNGERTITYEVTYVKGVETARKEVENVVTTKPINKITKVGAYVAPVQAPTSNSGSGYTNSQGNYVESPSSNPAGATAQCSDGTYSYSQSRKGTCSHHGGVASWL